MPLIAVVPKKNGAKIKKRSGGKVPNWNRAALTEHMHKYKFKLIVVSGYLSFIPGFV